MPDTQEVAPEGQQEHQEVPQEGNSEQSQSPAEQGQAPKPPKTYSEYQMREVRAEAAKYRSELQTRMTEAERAVAEAEERGRAAVRQEYGARLARERFDSLAARRNPGFKTSDALEYVDLSRFVGEDGELDEREIDRAVKRLVPEAAAAAPTGPPAFDGGVRTTAPQTPDFGQTLRQQLRRT